MHVELDSTAQNEFTTKVYDDIFSTMDNGRILKPKLKISDNPSEVATYSPYDKEGDPEIRLGVNFIELARAFGKDSCNVLAHVIGHELAHVLLQQNEFVKQIGSGYASKEYNKQLKKIHITLRDSVYERQADEFAGFYAHMAGYNTVNIAPQLLDSIYKKFGLKDSNLNRYPTLQERKLIAKNTKNQMNVLCDMFDAATLCMVAGEYDMSRAFFQTIIQEKFPSKEIHNNLGLSYLLDAIESLDSTEYPYVFPCEIDFQTKLDSESQRGLSIGSIALLKEALRHFSNATINKPEYYLAWLNKAITEFLLESKECEISVLRASNTLDANLKNQVNVFKAIMLHSGGESKKKALKMFKDLSNENDIARQNHLILTGRIHSVKKKELLKNDAEISDEVKSWLNITDPNFDFYSLESRKGDTLRKVINSGRNFKYRQVSNGKLNGVKWVFNKGSDKPSVKIYSNNNKVLINKKELDILRERADSSINFSHKSFLKFGNLFLIIENNSVQCKYIR